MPDEFDSPWKEALEIYLRSILEFCFPKAAAAINWDTPSIIIGPGTGLASEWAAW